MHLNVLTYLMIYLAAMVLVVPLAKRFGLPAYQPGLANIIAGREQIDDCLLVDEASGISLLAAGNVPPNPLELLLSPRFAELLVELSARYDRIIIDTPPVQAVSDSLVVAKQADAVAVICEGLRGDLVARVRQQPIRSRSFPSSLTRAGSR